MRGVLPSHPIYLGQPSHMELPQEPLVYRVEHWRKQESSVVAMLVLTGCGAPLYAAK
jgi:hypothetical protein